MTTADTHAHGSHGHDHPPFLAHHWETPQQQFEAGKLGMWLFLATEFLLFGGLFCAYSVYRFNHPEIFHYGSRFLDTNLGALNTVILIVSSLTMALAVSAAQLGRKNLLIGLLSLTVLGGAGFMIVKYFEYSHKFHENYRWGTTLYVLPEESHDHPMQHGSAAAHQDVEPAAELAAEVPPVEKSIDGLILPQTAVIPPAQAPTGIVAAEETDSEDTHQEEVAAQEGEHDAHAKHEVPPDPRVDPERPANAHIFFGIYFCMTGLHGLHVLAGMAVIIWLIVRAMKGEFGPGYFTPVDLGGLYWHVVDLIWIFLFPLLYLIG